jgi:A/G-specific adenine glycosylase
MREADWPRPSPDLGAFVERVAEEGARRYRDFAWRRTRDPYAVLVSEIMLQQTQVSRVERYYERWLEQFPTLDSLAAAPLEAVLQLWQGLGYNRRAVALKRLAEQLAEQTAPDAEPQLPRDDDALLALPGIGPATAAGVRAFAFGERAVYLETNVRSVLLHELFADADGVSDRELRPLLSDAAEEAERRGIDFRAWNYALLDYGAHLKRTQPNPSRRSAHHARQSRFEGSTRQKRARLLRHVMADPGQPTDSYVSELAEAEEMDGRPAPLLGEVLELLEALVSDGFLVCEDGNWRIS